MKVHIENQGDAAIRVIVDGDTVNDSMIDPGAAEDFESATEGIIELRELGGGEDAQGDASEQTERA
ncbi:hypothetical protein AWB76_02797 [Caballeronia temeraria]|uniref:Uncharacterized protein n=1 Tax=Caballeronia temeraria TaxID=1777137 RepID=A0A158ARQ3_9BURK|nr:hypothetical protein [Caballeronia temeraria]SAK59707.1 hypothetical protein AWB76_02797 [Caballeronia temeraria]